MWHNCMNINSKHCLKYGGPPGKAHSLVMETEFPLIKELENCILIREFLTRIVIVYNMENSFLV